MNWKTIAVIVAIGVIYCAGYASADSKWRARYTEFKLEAEQDYSSLLQKKIEADRENRARVSGIEREHLEAARRQKEQYEKTIANLRANFSPSGVLDDRTEDGNGLPRSGDDSAAIVCYSRDELQSRVERSLAIGRKADELALKYRALLEIIQ